MSDEFVYVEQKTIFISQGMLKRVFRIICRAAIRSSIRFLILEIVHLYCNDFHQVKEEEKKHLIAQKKSHYFAFVYFILCFVLHRTRSPICDIKVRTLALKFIDHQLLCLFTLHKNQKIY